MIIQIKNRKLILR